jgi:hypothetical protein
MKKTVTILSFLIPLFAFSQGWIWQSQIQGEAYLKVISVVTHSDGRSFVLLEYAGTLSVSGNTVSSNAGTNDIALAAFDAAGNYQWMQSIGSNDAEIAAGFAIDQANNCLYVSGDFKNTCSFGGSASLTSDGLYDAFLARYSLDGTLLNARRIAWGSTSQRATSLCVDNSGNVVATGIFLDAASFDGGISLTGNGTTSNYIVKYNAAGTIQWAKKTLGQYNVTWFRDIKPYSGGYVIAGQFRDTLFLDIQNIVSQAANMDMFLYAIDNNGNGQWVRTIKGKLGDDQFNRLTVSDHIYISGVTKSDTLVIQTDGTNFQTVPVSNAGNFDMMIMSYTTSGAYRWHKKYGSAGDDRALFVDAQNSKLAVGGYYSAAITIEGQTPLFSTGAEGFNSVYTSEGALSVLNSFNGAASDYIRAVKYFSGVNLVVAGESNSGQMDFGTLSATNGSSGNYFAFIAKWGCLDAVSLTHTPVSCLDGFGMPVVNDGTATVNPIGGRAPFTYAWSNGQNTQTATGLGLSTYHVTVTDANNCTITGSVTITASPVVSLAVSSFSDNTCVGGNNGSVTVTASNGKTPYNYLWNTSPVQQNTATASGLAAGTYICTVTDGCGNMATASGSIVLNSNLNATLTVTHVSCGTLSDGSIVANPTGNGSPFTYAWSNLATTQTISNLAAGTYTVTVTDICGATVVRSATVTQPAKITFSNLTGYCAGNTCSGAIQITVSGGYPAYTYLWSNGQTSPMPINLCDGSYTLTVTDSRGCTAVSKKIKVNKKGNCVEYSTSGAESKTNEYNVLVYPNPVSDNIVVSKSGGDAPFSVAIYDITGKKVYETGEKEITENAVEINVTRWNRGLYMITVILEDEQINQMIIVQ